MIKRSVWLLLIVVGIGTAMMIMRSRSSSRSEQRSWQTARDGFLYSAAVAPELDLTALASSNAMPQVVPVTLAIDNNTYRRQALPGAELHWSVRMLQADGSVLAEDSGVAATKPDDVLAPGDRWMRFIPVRVASLPSGKERLRLMVGMGWARADELTVQLATEAR